MPNPPRPRTIPAKKTSGDKSVYVPPEFALAAPPKLVRQLFALHGAASLLPPRTNGDSRALAKALFGMVVPASLHHDLNEFVRFASLLGRDAICEAGDDTKDSCPEWEMTPSPELALMVLLDRAKFAGLIERAEKRLARLLADRVTYEVCIGAGVPFEDEEALVGALRSLAGLADADVWVRRDGRSNKVYVAVIAEAPLSALAIPAHSSDAMPTVFVVDRFVYDPHRGRLSMIPGRPRHVQRYIRAWGEALRGDPNLFSQHASVALSHLSALGEAGLDGLPKVGRVQRQRVIACQVLSGDGDRLEARSRDALGTLGASIRRGALPTRATKRFNLDGAPWPVDAVIEPPWRLTIGGAGASEEDVDVVQDALEAMGAFDAGPREADATALLSGTYPEWRFDDVLGHETVVALKSSELISVVPGDATRRPATGYLGRVAESAIAFELTEGKRNGETLFYCISEDWAIPACTMRASELAMCKWHRPKVLAKWRREVGLKDRAAADLPKGVYAFGERQAGGGTLVFILVLRVLADDAERASLGKAITKMVKFGKPVVLTPKGRPLQQGFLELSLDPKELFGASSWLPKLRELLTEHEIDDDVPVEWRAQTAARVVADSTQGKVLVDGVAVDRASDTAYRLVKYLAEREAWADETGGKGISTEEMDKFLSGARVTEGTTRSAAYRLGVRVKETFSARRMEPPSQGKIVQFAAGRGWQLFARGEIV